MPVAYQSYLGGMRILVPQDMPGPKLPLFHVYACLFTRRDGTFHWALAIPQGDGSIVHKLHATNDDGGWRYECVNHTVVTSITMCVATKIGESSSLTCILLVLLYTNHTHH